MSHLVDCLFYVSSLKIHYLYFSKELFQSYLPSETEVDPGIIQDDDEMDDEDDDEVSQDDQGGILENCYLSMVDTLAKQVNCVYLFCKLPVLLNVKIY